MSPPVVKTSVRDLVADTARLQLSPNSYHPLDPLSAPEIASAVAAIKAYAAKEAAGAEHRVWFKSIQLIEPPKKILAPYLDKWHKAKATGGTVDRLPRRAESLLGIKTQDSCKWYGESPGSVGGRAAARVGRRSGDQPGRCGLCWAIGRAAGRGAASILSSTVALSCNDDDDDDGGGGDER